MRELKFAMYADISHSNLPVLTNRTKTETVLSNDVTVCDDLAGRVEPMMQCVADFRRIFADDLEYRCGIAVFDPTNKERVEVKCLPQDIAIACLLHPLVGGMCMLCF